MRLRVLFVFLAASMLTNLSFASPPANATPAEGTKADDEVVATRSYEHDLSCSEVMVPFPTTVGLTRPFGYRIVNEGLGNEGTVIRSQYWVFRPDGSQQVTASPVMDSTVLSTGEDTVFTPYNSSPWVAWTPDVIGPYVIRARSNLITDQDRSDDTAWTPTNVPANPDSNLAVMVRPAGEYELAYHTREKVSAFLNPRYIRYTPAADGVPGSVANAHDITTIRVMWQYNEALADTGATTWIEFWAAGTDTSPGPLIKRIVTKIDTGETVGAQNKPHWWTLDLTDVPELRCWSGDFWISLTPKDSIGGGPVPLPMGKSVDPVAYDGHHFVIRLDTVGTPLRPSPDRYLVQTTIEPAGPCVPVPPTDVTLIYNAATFDVELGWVDQAPNHSYKIYRSLTDPFNDAGFALLASVAPGVQFYADPVGVNTKAFYRMTGLSGPLVESGPSNTVGYIKTTCPADPDSTGPLQSYTPFGLAFTFWDVVSGIPVYGVVSTKPSDVIGAQLTGGPGPTGDRLICQGQGGAWAYRTTTSALWAGACETSGCMTAGSAFWIWSRHGATQDMILAGECDTSTFGPIWIAPNTYTPLSFRDARVVNRAHLNLLTSGFTGGTGATSDRLMEQGGGWCYYRTSDGTWQGPLVNVSPGKAYWIWNRHGAGWNYYYGPGVVSRPPERPGDEEGAIERASPPNRPSHSGR